MEITGKNKTGISINILNLLIQTPVGVCHLAL